ncbi:MAG: cupin domain-containing protein [Candidatus Electrothrix sp. AW3_4]|nr:cupin domain-containing protein [Candidatus Electrothrix gigas]
MTPDEIITLLNLEPHPSEGGYFRRTYESALSCTTENGSRMLLTSIYYMLTKESPVGFLHRNKSDILHYHHRETLQLLVPGGWWKASRLCAGESDYGLISEAVAPGFEYADNEIATEGLVQQFFPNIKTQLDSYIKRG